MTGDGAIGHERLLRRVRDAGVPYRLLSHAAEGRTDAASRLRGHDLASAAKSMLLAVHGPARVRHVLAVVPGDGRVDRRSVRRLYAARDVHLADRETAERLSGCVSGCIVPLSLDDAFPVVLDPALLDHPEVFFNAARLDVSMAVAPRHLLGLARPLVHAVSRRAEAGSDDAVVAGARWPVGPQDEAVTAPSAGTAPGSGRWPPSPG